MKATCKVEVCDRPVQSRGWCQPHYVRWLIHGDPGETAIQERRSPVEACIVDGCSKPPDKPRGENPMCQMHATRLKRNGTVAEGRFARGSIAERFWRFVTPAGPDECWEWQGSRNSKGYGRMGSIYAHRTSHEIHHGPIPEGLDVMHACDNPPCVNPAHLSAGTRSENLQQITKKGRRAIVAYGPCGESGCIGEARVAGLCVSHYKSNWKRRKNAAALAHRFRDEEGQTA